MQPQTVTIGLIQMRCTPEPDENLGRALEKIDQAAERGAQIVCLQELFRSEYFCQRENVAFFELAETIPGPSTEALAGVAAARAVTVVGSVFERRAEGVFHNTAVVIGPDGAIAGLYRKMHIPDDPLYYEKFYFSPGDLGFPSVATPQACIGTLVCWDQWFPEAARLSALHGSEILFYPTAIGWHPHERAEWGAAQHSAWETMQRAHAIANGVFVAVTNRVGREGKLEFWGASFVADPFGRVLARAGHEEEETLIVQCDRSRIAETRRNWPFLRDRRVDAYEGLTRRYIGAESARSKE
jgi:N-carbamoylputrescine amidase